MVITWESVLTNLGKLLRGDIRPPLLDGVRVPSSFGVVVPWAFFSFWMTGGKCVPCATDSAVPENINATGPAGVQKREAVDHML